MELALRCAEHEDFNARPTMAEVVAELEALMLQRDDNDSASASASAAGTSGSSAMADDDEPAAGVREVAFSNLEKHNDEAFSVHGKTI